MFTTSLLARSSHISKSDGTALKVSSRGNSTMASSASYTGTLITTRHQPTIQTVLSPGPP